MLASIVSLLFLILEILILARVILSFVPPNSLSYDHPARVTVFNLTEPMLLPIRQILPPMGGLDFSPMILLIIGDMIRRILLSILR